MKSLPYPEDEALLLDHVRGLLRGYEKAESPDRDDALLQHARGLLQADDSLQMDSEIGLLKPEQPGEWIGRYKLVEPLGKGGFGVVWVAEQEAPVRRRVALKIIKLGMDTREVIARFNQERQALAMMDHPNIAKVLDAGATEWGRPFFVMELVRGTRITDYCSEEDLSVEQRLELFVKVCQAVQHAHQKGIIHRDLKPSNILVSLHDGVPVPKIIDFGVAKATQQTRLTDLTLSTQANQMIGTPLYMSPEQAATSGLDIDTRSDIYSLGVLLYELLTGRTPFDLARLKRSGLDEWRRVVREEEPRKPSTHLSTLRGDLDCIILKALEKDRSRRYETANGFALDTQRHLDNEPVLARPQSAFYRFERLVRRNKIAFSAATVVAVALIGALGVSTWSFLREQAQRREADHQREVAKASAEQALQNEVHARRRLYASDMNLAQQAAEANRLTRARRLLDRHRPRPGQEDLRGWEWRWLWQQCLSEAVAALPQGTEPALSVSFSPNGNRLAVAYHNGRVELWDVPTRTLTKVLQEDKEELHPASVAFSPVADTLATSDASAVRWYDFAAGTEKVLYQAPGPIRDLAFSYDGSLLAIRSMAGTAPEAALVVAVGSGDLVRRVDLPPGNSAWFNSSRISPDGERLYVTYGAFREPGLRCVRISDGSTIWEKKGREPIQQDGALGFSALDISPDGKLVATAMGYAACRIQLWRAEDGERLGTLGGHTGYVRQLAFSRDGKILAAASGDKTTRLWDTASWRQAIAPLRGHGDEVNSVALTADGRMIATGSKDGVMLWDARVQKATGGRQMLPKDTRSARVLPDSRTAVLSNKEGDFSLFDLVTLRETKLPFSQGKHAMFGQRNFLGVQMNPDLFALHEINASGATLIAELPIQPLAGFAYSPEKRLLAWTAEAKTIHLTNIDNPAKAIDLTSDDKAAAPVRFSADGRFLLAANPHSAAQVWDVTGRCRLASAEAYLSPFDAPIFGRYSNAARGDILLRWITHATSPRMVSRDPARTGPAPAGFFPPGLFADRAFSPDGRTFAIATEREAATLYDAIGVEKLATLHTRGRIGVGPRLFPGWQTSGMGCRRHLGYIQPTGIGEIVSPRLSPFLRGVYR